jgi:hypothetical protein
MSSTAERVAYATGRAAFAISRFGLAMSQVNDLDYHNKCFDEHLRKLPKAGL